MLDDYLAKTGYKGQQTNEPADPSHQNNLYAPLPGDHGAHGDFDEKAWNCSLQFWLARHKAVSWAAVALVGFGAGFLIKYLNNKIQ